MEVHLVEWKVAGWRGKTNRTRVSRFMLVGE
jgi:hypothetical protein